MDDGTPSLEVGFAIDTGSSFQELELLQNLMNSAEVKILQDVASIERATSGMLNLGSATAKMQAFGNATTKEAQSAARELAKVESAGERLSREMDRTASSFGKTKEEMRAAKVEAAALAAEQKGLTELADRLRSQQAGLTAQIEQAATARRVEADATAAAAREHAELAARVQGVQAAMVADADAAERMRAATDPLYAATVRLNAEIAESTRLYHTGATAPEEYARQQEVLAGRLRDVQQAYGPVNQGVGTLGNTGKLAGHHMQNLAFQFQDLGVQMGAALASSHPLKGSLIALMQQGAQIQGIMSQAGIGIRGVGVAFVDMSKAILLATVTNPILLGLAATIGLFAGAVSLLNNAANDSKAVEDYAKSLGLTKDQIEELGGATVTWGDTAKAVFQVAGRAIWGVIGPAVTSVWDTMKEWTAWIFSGVKAAVNFVIGGWVGAYNIITTSWRKFPAVIGDLFYSGVNAGIDAINGLIQKAVSGVNGFISQANLILSKAGLALPSLDAPQIARVNNQYAGAASQFGKTVRAEMGKAMGVDYIGMMGGAIVAQAQQNAKDRLRTGAEEKGFLDDKGNKGSDRANAADKHAEALQREADAVAAQIKNLYALAAAYGVSGAAALIAEARVKAESDAIKDRADIEQRVSEQIQLSVAQRVSDAAKSTAALRDQIAAQEEANNAARFGILTSEQAAQYVKDRIADLPLLAAIEAAQMSGLEGATKAATQALEEQQAARLKLRDVEEQARFNTAAKEGDNQLAMLREELRLMGATNAEREIALTTLKATQEAEAKFDDPARQAAYVKQQVEIVQATRQLTEEQERYNRALTASADYWANIAAEVQKAAQGMSEAFGKFGQALGDIASAMANYRAEAERAKVAHQAKLDTLNDEAAKQAEVARFNRANMMGQIGLFGDLAASAKGFFKEGTSGYKALQKAEQVFRAIQFALSVRAMVQDAIETASSLANSGIRTAKLAIEAVTKAIASMPFPLNLVAGAATMAALVAIGASIAGSFGGSGKKSIEKANDGTGTVFGDAKAKSESITNAINALKEVDTVMLDYSRQMAASLASIESQIGNFAKLLVRNADSINANGGVNAGFKPNAIGSIFGAIPLIGGLVKSLFGTKTTIVGSGLYGGDQSLGSILSGGFDAQYYSDIQKKKKFFGLTTSTRYSTQFTDADANLEKQFTLILRSFNAAILAAAGPLGTATSEIEARLSGFVVRIGKIDLKGLTGAQIEEKLNAVFGAAADDMARAAFPMIEQFQKVGEGAFETLVRVSSTIEQVTASLGKLGQQADGLDIVAKLGLADQFDSIGDFSNAINGYFTAYYTKEEQRAARMAQMAQVFSSLGLTLPGTLSAFRALVEAQDLTTEAGRETYTTLIKLAPAFADLQSALEGAKSAADIASERADLQRQLLELQGDTAALRALQLAKLDVSNRALQLQIWAIQDAKEAAKAAEELRDAWKSVGDTIMDEVKRIRGLSDATGATGFAALQGQFNAATALARAGDMEAAKSLPELSQALLTAAANAATSRQELDRVRAQTAASLESTNSLIAALANGTAGTSDSALLDALTGGGNSGAAAGNDNAIETLSAGLDALREEMTELRRETTAGLSAVAGHTGAIKRKFEDVTAQSGGDAIATVSAAA